MSLWPHLSSEFERLDRLIEGACHPADGAPAIAARDETSPIARVASMFDLDEVEQDLLLLALAPEADPRYQAVFGALQELRHSWPTPALALRLLGAGGGPSLYQILAALGGDGRLVRNGLVRSLPTSGPVHLVTSPYALSAPATHFLLALDRLPADLATLADRTGHAESPTPSLSNAARTALARIAALLGTRSGAERPVVVLVDEMRAGRGAAALLAASLGQPLMAVDLAAPALADALPMLGLYLRLFPHVLLLHGAADADGLTSILARLEQSNVATVVSCRSRAVGESLASRVRSVSLDLGAGAFDEREDAWNRALIAERVYLAPDDRAALADRFAVSPAQMTRAIQAAVDGAAIEPDDRPFSAAVIDATRRLLEAQAIPFATKITAPTTWTDLVLPPAVAARLRELAGAIRHSRVVYRDWGFDRRTSAGTGVKAMFAGPSGTGKTMTAAVIANELGFDLYRIDLARVVSKYVGETEKHLDAIFAAAAGGQAILLFDEADALFGKRSEVNDAHDRYANIEVSFLLQRLEDHPGVAILATNLRGNIDEAFARRLHYVIDFPRPDPAARVELWRRMFSDRVPMAGDIDWTFLATQFPLSGGDIRNVALEAAFLAAQNGRVVSMRHLVRAIGRQVVKEGRLPTAAAFQHYHPLVTAD